MSALQALHERQSLPRWRPVAWAVALLLAVLLGWSAVGELDEVAVAQGEVVPQGNVKVVQHLEGGLILGIHVHEGQRVAAGDPLVQLDLAVGTMDPEDLRIQRDALRLEAARLEAQARNAEQPDFPEGPAERSPAVTRGEREAFAARREELQHTLKGLRDKVRERELEIEETRRRVKALQAELKVKEERLALTEGLLSDQLASRAEYLEIASTVQELKGRLDVARASIPRLQAGLSSMKERIGETRARFRHRALDRLSQVEEEIARLLQRMETADDQQRRTLIRSPIQGVVKNMRYHTVGGVVKAGEPIMEIVPTRERMVISARLAPADRGYVRRGQRALVKISTYDYIRYGGLEGKVTMVAPDTTQQSEGPPYFEVRVMTNRSHLGEDGESFPISPGMLATVDIHTGTRTVLDYLIRPVLKLRHEAFRER